MSDEVGLLRHVLGQYRTVIQYVKMLVVFVNAFERPHLCEMASTGGNNAELQRAIIRGRAYPTLHSLEPGSHRVLCRQRQIPMDCDMRDFVSVRTRGPRQNLPLFDLGSGGRH